MTDSTITPKGSYARTRLEFNHRCALRTELHISYLDETVRGRDTGTGAVEDDIVHLEFADGTTVRGLCAAFINGAFFPIRTNDDKNYFKEGRKYFGNVWVICTPIFEDEASEELEETAAVAARLAESRKSARDEVWTEDEKELLLRRGHGLRGRGDSNGWDTEKLREIYVEEEDHLQIKLWAESSESFSDYRMSQGAITFEISEVVNVKRE